MASYTLSPRLSTVHADDLFSPIPGTPASERPLGRFLEEDSRVFFETPAMPSIIPQQPVHTPLRVTPQPWSVQSLSSLGSRALSPTSEYDFVMESNMSPFTPEAVAPSPHLSQVVPPLWPGQEGFQEIQLPGGFTTDATAMVESPRYDESGGDHSPHIKNEEPILDLSPPFEIQSTDSCHLAYGGFVDPAFSLAGQSHTVASPLHADDAFSGPAQLSLPSQYLPPDNAIYKTDHPQPFIPIISPTKTKRQNAKARRDNKQATRRCRSSAWATAPTSTSPEFTRSSATTTTFDFPPTSSSFDPRPYVCTEPNCPDSYPTSHLLKKHIHTYHRRPFKCIFHYASCPATFTKKNEWKRHVKTQHLVAEYWHCTTGHCQQAQPLHARNSMTSNGVASWGSVFKRKDLYTQHVRRMHLETNPVDKSAEERKLNRLLEMAKKVRCRTPAFMTCPVVHCDKDFRGKKAWEERMEHVAVHLEAAEDDEEDEVMFGSVDDPTLVEWAESEEVDIVRKGEDGELQCWDPLKGCTVTQISDKN